MCKNSHFSLLKYNFIYSVFLAIFPTVFSCSTVKYIPVETIKEIYIKDTTYLRDTVIQYKLEKQYVRDYTGLLDTLNLETNVAKSTAYIDTSKNILTGSIENKQDPFDIQTQYKERVIYRDSIQIREVPVEIEVEKVVRVVPWWAKILSWIGGLSLAVAAGWVISKFV